MTTLYINRNDSRCGTCRRNADPFEPAHTMERMRGTGCGGAYDSVSTDYWIDEALCVRVREMRPDLPFVGRTLPEVADASGE